MTTTTPTTQGRPFAGAPGAGKTVALFATCANDVMFPQAPMATTQLLERLGCRVVFPKKQTSCTPRSRPPVPQDADLMYPKMQT